jgi:trk system potassium uptake protein TrkH
MLTCLLMLIGGAPGSIAGGIKVTTLFVILVVMLRKPDSEGDIRIFHHRLTGETIHTAGVYFLKALALLLICIIALLWTEKPAGSETGDIIFEVISAFATVGLSLDFTSSLTPGGKLVIIAAMFSGRVGLIALAFPAFRSRNYAVNYPEGVILLG